MVLGLGSNCFRLNIINIVLFYYYNYFIKYLFIHYYYYFIFWSFLSLLNRIEAESNEEQDLKLIFGWVDG